MALLVDYSQEWKWIDGVETGNLKHSAGGADRTCKILRRDDDAKDVSFAANAGLQTDTVTWIVWFTSAGSAPPEPGDMITDADGKKWTVGPVRNNKLLGHSTCYCQRKQ